MKRIFILLCAICIIANLRAEYAVYISSFGNYSLEGKNFIIDSVDPEKSNDIEFEQYASKLAQYLILNGANYVEKGQDADIYILLDYGIGESAPLISQRPIFGETGVSSITTSTDYWGNTRSYVNYSHGVVGYSTEQVDQYRRFIDVYAYDFKSIAKERPKMLWKTNIESTGWKNNFQAICPFMLYAARNYFGKATSQKIEIRLPDNLYDYNAVAYYAERGYYQNGKTYKKPYIQSVNERALMLDLSIYAIILTNRETIVIFEYGSTNNVKISSNIILEVAGRQYHAKSSYGVGLDYNVPKYNRYFSVVFNPIPMSTTRIDAIQDGTKKKIIRWEGIEIR